MTEIEQPKAVMKGRFNLFETPDGGYHIAYQKDEEFRSEGEPEIMHIEVPGFVINGAKMFADSGANMRDIIKMGLEARRGAKQHTASAIGQHPAAG
jgi:hypothetical protein